MNACSTNNSFYGRDANNAGPTNKVACLGSSGNKPLAGDWDGNGSSTPGVYQTNCPNTGNTWALTDAFDGPVTKSFSYGVACDEPIAGDWDGNGTVTPGVVRGGNQWYLKNCFPGVDPGCNGNADISISWGSSSGDKHVVGKWNTSDCNPILPGTQVCDRPGIFRPAGPATWFLMNTFDPMDGVIQYIWGLSSDSVVSSGDWNADGVDTPAIIRGTQDILRATNTPSDPTATVFDYGNAGEPVISGDWDTNGVDSIGRGGGNI